MRDEASGPADDGAGPACRGPGLAPTFRGRRQPACTARTLDPRVPQGGGSMRMKSPLAALFMAAALLVPCAARASDQPAWSVSLLGGYEQYSHKLFYPSDSLANAPVAGLRFGRAF